MHIAGVQPVGSKGLASLQLVVADRDAVKQVVDPRTNAPRVLVPAPNTISREPVVFPREGLPMDQRPPHLRQQKAAVRYRESQVLASHGDRSGRQVTPKRAR